jgi:hypothetical protein
MFRLNIFSLYINLCNAHILRELNLALEMGQSRSSAMIELLLDLKILVECHWASYHLQSRSGLEKHTEKSYMTVSWQLAESAWHEHLEKNPDKASKLSQNTEICSKGSVIWRMQYSAL